MTDRRPGERPLNDAHAARTLSDAALILYAARQAAKLFWAIILKRFPELS
jgi:hypothetical protein